ncbi:MAG: hypothetical protein K2O39_06230, partial [Clostridiales bacterium]|nr:hypothetical protein [Clostridiales bacterium]
FKGGHYYKREMGGSFSIKSVLPAVFPDKSYHNLYGVQNGMDAMYVFPRLKDYPRRRRKRNASSFWSIASVTPRQWYCFGKNW